MKFLVILFQNLGDVPAQLRVLVRALVGDGGADGPVVPVRLRDRVVSMASGSKNP